MGDVCQTVGRVVGVGIELCLRSLACGRVYQLLCCDRTRKVIGIVLIIVSSKVVLTVTLNQPFPFTIIEEGSGGRF